MSLGPLFSSDARRVVHDAVATIELGTSAEIVVAVRRTAGHYRHADYLAGTISALVVLCVFLYHPRSFDFTYLPLELAAWFGLGVACSAFCPPVRRALTSGRLLRENVRRAAHATFFELGIAETHARTGILVFVSGFERRVEVVVDRGVAAAPLGPEWSQMKARLEVAIEHAPALERLVSALQALAPVLAEALPRHPDDVNELPDDLNEASEGVAT